MVLYNDNSSASFQGAFQHRACITVRLLPGGAPKKLKEEATETQEEEGKVPKLVVEQGVEGRGGAMQKSVQCARCRKSIMCRKNGDDIHGRTSNRAESLVQACGGILAILHNTT